MRFFVGLHQPSDARHFDAAFVSVNRLRGRKRPFAVQDWIMDSGAFSTIATHGGYPHGVEEYAGQIHRWQSCGNLLAAVSQDFMCEPAMLAKTGLSVADHQRLTIERYDALRPLVADVYVMPVLQGYTPAEYVSHLRQYGARLTAGMWVGVGSVCKRNGDVRAIEAVLLAIHAERPDLRLHGFGLKTTALQSGLVRELLETADSMAWSFSARKQGRNANDWREAERFVRRIDGMVAPDEVFAQIRRCVDDLDAVDNGEKWRDKGLFLRIHDALIVPAHHLGREQRQPPRHDGGGGRDLRGGRPAGLGRGGPPTRPLFRSAVKSNRDCPPLR